jgi:alkanesulfonate monooxygenase SsuD/methylene tetrahydromethanopterin reductase-like flavin-dependent oxidoreductase (luciferase family)
MLGSEADLPPGSGTLAQRYEEMLEEALFAEEMGFHGVRFSEQHFNPILSLTSAPECIMGWIAAKTTKVRLRITSFVLLPFNHPLRIAEQVATLDVLSGGRFEVGTARSNNPRTLKAFQVDPNDTRAMWFESMELLRKALTYDEVEHHGKYWTVDPPIQVTPRPVQKPHPPIFVSATSVETHGNAGKLGIGVMTGNSLPGGWSYIAEALQLYRDGLEEADPGPGGVVNESAGAASVITYCAETKEEAMAAAAERTGRFLGEVAKWFTRLSKESPDYVYMAELQKILEQEDSLERIIERSPYVSIGTPDFFVERGKRLQELGYNEWLLNMDGMRHDEIMKSIELVGKHVIPALT